MKLKAVAALCLVIALSACSSNQVGPKSSKQPIAITYVAPNPVITFSGKAAGAGAALMGVMGPAGIAIGVAIDKGIENSINKAAAEVDFDLTPLLQQKIADARLSSPVLTEWVARCGQLNFSVEEYGIRLKSGGGDLGIVYLKGEFISGSCKAVIELPSNKEIAQNLPSRPLAQIKTDGVQVQSLWAESLSVHWQEHWLLSITTDNLNTQSTGKTQDEI